MCMGEEDELREPVSFFSSQALFPLLDTSMKNTEGTVAVS